jgi:hypothetical protein
MLERRYREILQHIRRTGQLQMSTICDGEIDGSKWTPVHADALQKLIKHGKITPVHHCGALGGYQLTDKVSPLPETADEKLAACKRIVELAIGYLENAGIHPCQCDKAKNRARHLRVLLEREIGC